MVFPLRYRTLNVFRCFLNYFIISLSTLFVRKSILFLKKKGYCLETILAKCSNACSLLLVCWLYSVQVHSTVEV